VDVKWELEECSDDEMRNMPEISANDDEMAAGERLKLLTAIKLADGEWIEGSAFVETTGSSGPMGGCAEYGRGCSMCVLRCPAFGPRVSISQRAGLPDLAGKRKAGQFGAFSGSGKLEMASLSPELQEELRKKGVAVVPLPPEKIVREKLEQKVCQQYALAEYAENIILIDTGHAKIMTPYFPLEVLRTIPGFETARYADPYAGGKGNSIRYLSIAERDNTMRVKGFENLFCGGEKSGLFVGHTEAITTGSLAGHNAARWLASQHLTHAGLLRMPRSIAAGDLIAYGNEKIKTEADVRGFLEQFGWQVSESPLEQVTIRIPNQFDKVMNAYNELQKSQGLDLSKYKDKDVIRYTYQITNYPDYSGTVFANVILYKNKVIGGDICSSDVTGFISGFFPDNKK